MAAQGVQEALLRDTQQGGGGGGGGGGGRPVVNQIAWEDQVWDQ